MNLRLLFFLPLFLFSFYAEADSQIVYCDPALPTAGESVTVFFDATQGNQGLINYTEDIYAHTGVVTNQSNGGWKYVKTSWGENTEATKLSKVSDNLYSLEITPTIREYYDVPEAETILKMAFVFRSHDNAKEGKDTGNEDIFHNVYADGLSLQINTPDKTQLLETGAVVECSASASEESEMKLYLNDNLISTETSTNISHTFTLNNTGDYWMKVTATKDEEVASDSVFVHILGTQSTGSTPSQSIYGINYIDDNTVTLALHAPNKEHVFAIGDFNNWTPSDDYRMTLDEDVYWITLTNLEAGKEYAFQYLVNGELRIADPYTEIVLDESNDKWISEDTYPNLREFPSEYTSGLASVFQTAQTPYEWKTTNFVAPEKTDLVVYELLVRDFVAAHDWQTLTDTLDYLSRLGINAIELMPFNEFEGNESWGYNPSFYFAADKYYGPKEDLKVFIDSCHSRGIAVIMDIVWNHSFSQSPLVQLYYNSATGKVTSENPWYNIDSPNTSYYWGFDFDHESDDFKQFMYRANNYWLTEYNLDGFRFDFTKGFTNTSGDGWAYDASRIQILKNMANQIWATKADAYVILEHLTDNSEEKELSNAGIMLWGNMNYNYNEASMGWNEGDKSDFKGVSYKSRGWSEPALVGYMESHDEERLMFKNLEYGNASGDYNIQRRYIALERMELVGAFFFTIPGPKMIWQFGELGYDYSIDYNGRVGNKPIRWDYLDVDSRMELYQVYSELIHLKTSEPAFATTDYSLSLYGTTKRIELNHESMDVRIIGNFDVVDQSIDPSFSTTGYWYDYFSGDSINVTDVNAQIDLAPGEYRLYTTKHFDTPDIIDNLASEKIKTEIKLYPNPASDLLQIDAPQILSKIEIFDINGRHIQTIYDIENTQHSIPISSYSEGMYILRAVNIHGQSTHKAFIKH